MLVYWLRLELNLSLYLSLKISFLMFSEFQYCHEVNHNLFKGIAYHSFLKASV